MSEDPSQEKQNPAQGTDQNVDGPTDPSKLKDIKMTGDAAPGSHSAVFGLTPDGQKHTDTSTETTAPKPAHSGQTAMGGGKVPSGEDQSHNTTSNQSSGAGVASQMHDPNVAEKAHGGGAVESTAGAGEKPGAGTGTESLSQGSGDVQAQKESGGTIMDKAKSYLVGGSSQPTTGPTTEETGATSGN